MTTMATKCVICSSTTLMKIDLFLYVMDRPYGIATKCDCSISTTLMKFDLFFDGVDWP